MLFYRSSLPLSRSTLDYVTGLVRRHRQKVRSKGRALPPGRQALMTIAYLKNGETYQQLAAGFGVGTTTAWRYVNETVMLLSARSPKLERALAKAKKDGLRHLVLDGTLIAIDRLAADRLFYSGKLRKHGVNLQVIAGPGGQIVWVSGAVPGSIHDLTAARNWGVIRALAGCGLLVLADKVAMPVSLGPGPLSVMAQSELGCYGIFRGKAAIYRGCSAPGKPEPAAEVCSRVLQEALEGCRCQSPPKVRQSPSRNSPSPQPHQCR